jgi:hypothetical protein
VSTEWDLSDLDDKDILPVAVWAHENLSGTELIDFFEEWGRTAAVRAQDAIPALERQLDQTGDLRVAAKLRSLRRLSK